MDRSTRTTLYLAALLVGVPEIVNAIYSGSYVIDPDGNRRTFWIGPISTTVPFVILAIVFFSHRAVSRAAYWGAGAAWLSMMGLTMFLISQAPGPQSSSTMAIAVLFTPICYLPVLVVPYALGTVVGRFVNRSALRQSSP